MTLKRVLFHARWIIIGGLILNFYGFYNRFPFIYPDSGTYLISGIKNFVPYDRPLLYGLFLRHVSLLESLWIPMVAQGMILSYLLYAYFHYFLKNRYKHLLFLVFIAFITSFTAVSIHASMLIPDIFTSVTILSLGLLVFVEKHQWLHFSLISFCLFLGMGTHNSHTSITVCIMLVFTFLFMFKTWRNKMVFISLKRVVYIWTLIIVGNTAIATLHASFGGGFSVTKGKHAFLISRTHDMGLLKSFLDRKCERNGYQLCAYKDSLTPDFLWDPNSPFAKMGGWEATKSDYNQILADMFQDAYMRNKFVMKTIEATLQQMATFDAGDIGYHDSNSPMVWPLSEKYPHHFPAFYYSLQNTKRHDFTLLNNLQRIIIVFSFVFALAIISLPTLSHYKFPILFILLALMFNAFICTLSGVLDRLQSRVAWIIVLPVFLYACSHLSLKKLVDRGFWPKNH